MKATRSPKTKKPRAMADVRHKDCEGCEDGIPVKHDPITGLNYHDVKDPISGRTSSEVCAPAPRARLATGAGANHAQLILDEIDELVQTLSEEDALVLLNELRDGTLRRKAPFAAYYKRMQHQREGSK